MENSWIIQLCYLGLEETFILKLKKHIIKRPADPFRFFKLFSTIFTKSIFKKLISKT